MSRPFGPFWGPGSGLSPTAGAVRPVVLDRFMRTGAGDGGRRPGFGTLPADGAVRSVGRDRFTRTGAGDGGTGRDTLPAGGRSGRSDWTGSRGPLRATGGSRKP